MTNAIKLATISAAALVMVAGCKKTADNSVNYKSAINTYYTAHPVCLWPTAQKFPQQIASSNDDQNRPFAALVDQGMLVRGTSEKKIVIFSKQETNYDLSDKGRGAWTADPTQPNYGNFCFGSATVSSLDNSTPNNGEVGATTVVTYHYALGGAPDWAKAAVIQNAFPRLQAALAGGVATATLVDTSDGWKMQTPPPSSKVVTPADGKIVE